jgi:hypothetical protein
VFAIRDDRLVILKEFSQCIYDIISAERCTEIVFEYKFAQLLATNQLVTHIYQLRANEHFLLREKKTKRVDRFSVERRHSGQVLEKVSTKMVPSRQDKSWPEEQQLQLTYTRKLRCIV